MLAGGERLHEVMSMKKPVLLAITLIGSLCVSMVPVAHSAPTQTRLSTPSYVAGLWDCGRICVDKIIDEARPS